MYHSLTLYPFTFVLSPSPPVFILIYVHFLNLSSILSLTSDLHLFYSLPFSIFKLLFLAKRLNAAGEIYDESAMWEYRAVMAARVGMNKIIFAYKH